MTRHLGIALAALVAFLIVLAEVERMHEDVTEKIEQQRSFNAHQ